MNLAFAQQTIVHVTSDPVKELMLPVAEKLRHQTEQAFKEEDRLRTHPEEVDEGAVAEVDSCAARAYVILIKDLLAECDACSRHLLILSVANKVY